jgi:hypothetical protein
MQSAKHAATIQGRMDSFFTALSLRPVVYAAKVPRVTKAGFRRVAAASDSGLLMVPGYGFFPGLLLQELPVFPQLASVFVVEVVGIAA